MDIDDAKTADELIAQTQAIKDETDEMLKSPEVAVAYEATGRPPQVAFLTASTMARRRFDGIFKHVSISDPFYARMLAEMRHIAAECILLSARCRLRRQPYDAVKDATIRCRKFARDNAERFRAAFDRHGV